MGKPLSSFKQKVDWMRSHESLWRGWPQYDRIIERNVLTAMRRDGLISEKTHNAGVMDFGKLISAARNKTSKVVLRTVVVRFWTAHVVLVLLVAGCRTTQVLPPSPAGVIAKVSAKAKPAFPFVCTRPDVTMRLVWDYPNDPTDIVYELYSTTNFKTFSFWAVTTETQIVINLIYPKQGFIVRASNTVSGLFSPWNTK